MAKNVYGIPADLNATYADMEIAIQSKDGVGAKPLPIKVILTYVGSIMLCFYICSQTIVKYGELWQIVLFVVLWFAMDLPTYEKEPKWWLKCTFFYYCAHDMILESVEKLILIVGGRSITMALVDFILAPVITFGILFVGAWIVRKYMPPVWKLLNGGR